MDTPADWEIYGIGQHPDDPARYRLDQGAIEKLDSWVGQYEAPRNEAYRRLFSPQTGIIQHEINFKKFKDSCFVLHFEVGAVAKNSPDHDSPSVAKANERLASPWKKLYEFLVKNPELNSILDFDITTGILRRKVGIQRISEVSMLPPNICSPLNKLPNVAYEVVDRLVKHFDGNANDPLFQKALDIFN